MPRKRRILIVDDEPISRLGFRRLVADRPDLSICGEAATTDAGLEAVAELHPELVLLDIVIQGDLGLELIKDIRRDGDVPILVCSRRGELVFAERCLQAGATGYVGRRAPLEEILQAIRTTLDGQVYLSDRVSQRVLTRIVHGYDAIEGTSIEDLTDRELEVLELLGRGLTTRQVAEQLTIAMKTVQAHCQNIRSKLGLANSNQLVRRAVHWVLEDR